MLASVLIISSKKIENKLIKLLMIFVIVDFSYCPMVFNPLPKRLESQNFNLSIYCHAGRRTSAFSIQHPILSPVYYLIEMTWPYAITSSNIAANLYFRLVWVGFVCIQKKNPRYLPTHMVHNVLRFLHLCSKQAMALCRLAFPNYGNFSSGFHDFSIQIKFELGNPNS